MKIIAGFIFYFVSSIMLLFAQSNSEILKLQKYYESFEYTKVISKSGNLLLDKKNFSDQLLLKLYSVKAASHYAIDEKENSRKTYIELLKIDNKYKLNRRDYSPKLVDFFNEIKSEFLEIVKLNGNKTFNGNKKFNEKRITQSDIEPKQKVIKNEMSLALAKSIVFPGWGHLHFNNDTKGWILTTGSAITLGSMIYYINETNKMENAYLSEIDTKLIQTKYDQYNKLYKIRNALIVTYAAIWLYTQIDLLFFQNELGSSKPSFLENISIHQKRNKNIEFSYRIPL